MAVRDLESVVLGFELVVIHGQNQTLVETRSWRCVDLMACHALKMLDQYGLKKYVTGQELRKSALSRRLRRLTYADP